MADSTTSIEDDVVTAGLIAVGAAAVAAAVGVWWALRHPRTTLAVAVPVVAYLALGPAVTVTLVAGLVAVGVAWRRWHRASFDRCFLGAWRRAWVYAWGWRQAMTMAGLGDVYRHPDSLTEDLAGVERRPVSRYVPKLGRVRSDRWCDRVTVRLLAGQHPGMYADRTDHLAHTFGARSCRVECPRPGRVVLVFRHRDPLATIVPALPIDPSPALWDLPVGLLEDGQPWTVQLAGSHLLVAGATGAGKGSVIWSLIRGVAACVHEGTVQLWCVDPKGGMELAAGAPMFTRFAYDQPGRDGRPARRRGRAAARAGQAHAGRGPPHPHPDRGRPAGGGRGGRAGVPHRLHARPRPQEAHHQRPRRPAVEGPGRGVLGGGCAAGPAQGSRPDP